MSSSEQHEIDDVASAEPPAATSGRRDDDAAQAGNAERIKEYRGTGIMWTAFAVVVVIALAVIASFQNTQDVEVEFLWMDGSVPLVLLLLIVVGSTVVVTEAVGVVWRHRRRRRLRERDELRRLRGR